jgi:hypothetical protein
MTVYLCSGNGALTGKLASDWSVKILEAAYDELTA